MKSGISFLKFNKLPVLLFFVMISQIAKSQSIDSLQRIFASREIDTNFVKAGIDLAWAYMYNNADSAKMYADKSIASAKKINNGYLLANGYNALGVVNIVQGNYDEAIDAIEAGVAVTRQLLEKQPENRLYIRRILALYNNMGNVHYYRAEYSKAIDNYIKSLNYSNQIDFVAGKANCISNIGAAYKDMLSFTKALEYNYKALNLARQVNDGYLLSQSLNNLGATYYSVPNYDSALYYFTQSTKRFEQSNNEFELINSYVNMGDIYRHFEQFDTALIYYKRAISISKKLKSTDGLINAYYMVGQLYNAMGNHQKAITNFNKSLELSRQSGTSRFIMLNLEELSKTYVKQKNYKEAYNSFYQSSIVRDSIFSEERDARIAEMETKFRTKEKEEKIKLLTKQNELNIAKAKNRQVLFFSVVIILILLLLALGFAYTAYRNKQKVIRATLQQKAEKKTLDAVVRTEHNERKRFAGELHDSMGALLSTLKLYVNELGDSNKAEEKQQLLARANELLDEASNNTRTISHQIMPASIKEQGLEYALRSFTDKINASGKINIDFNTPGLGKHHDEILELSVYRMCLEMINNTLKHALATKIEITLIEKNGFLYLSYSDNGKGFNINDTLKSKQRGIGLENILNRIEILGGTFRFNSKKNKGFNAEIKIPV